MDVYGGSVSTLITMTKRTDLIDNLKSIDLINDDNT